MRLELALAAQPGGVTNVFPLKWDCSLNLTVIQLLNWTFECQSFNAAYGRVAGTPTQLLVGF